MSGVPDSVPVPVPHGVLDHEHHEAKDEAGHPCDHVGCPPALAENIEPGQINAGNLELQDEVFLMVSVCPIKYELERVLRKY